MNPLLLALISAICFGGLIGMAAYVRGEFAPTQGEEEFVFSAPASATVIEIGDWLYQDPTTRQPKPASAMTDQLTAALNQDAFQQYFLGVAEQRSPSGSTSKIRIAVRGRKHVDVDAGSYKVGDLLGMDEQASGTALENRKLTSAANASRAVARVCEEPASSSATKVWVDFRSTIMFGGLQVTVAGSSSGAI